jgi:hypothetical protein
VETIEFKGPVNRLGKLVILGDVAALILKICLKKITKIDSRQGAASKMFRDTSANSSFIALLISLKSANSLLGKHFYSKYIFMCFCKYTNSFRNLGKYMQLKVIN